MLGLHHEQHLCLRSVTYSPSGMNNECIKRRPFPSALCYHTLFFNVLPRWLWELECFLRFSMSDAFTLPFRLGDRRKSFLPLDWYCSSGLQAPFRRERKQLSKRSTTRDPRLGSRASTSTVSSASFWPKSNAIRRVRSRPRNAPFFPWQLGVRKFTDLLPDCLKSMQLSSFDELLSTSRRNFFLTVFNSRSVWDWPFMKRPKSHFRQKCTFGPSVNQHHCMATSWNWNLETSSQSGKKNNGKEKNRKKNIKYAKKNVLPLSDKNTISTVVQTSFKRWPNA